MKLTLADLLDNLAVGEFSQTAWGEEGEFSIPIVNKLIPLINAGIGDISSRFWVKRKEVYIRTCPGKVLYVIDKVTANQEAKLKGGRCYLITPTGETYNDDLVEIYKIFDGSGRELAIGIDAGEPHEVWRTCGCGCNKKYKPGETPHYTDNPCRVIPNDNPGITTRKVNRCSPYGEKLDTQEHYIALAAYNAVRIPSHYYPQRLKVVYRASPVRLKKIEDDGLYDPARISLDLPYSYMEALIYYIASRRFNPNMQGVNTGFHEGNNYYQKYLSACALIQDQGLDVMPGIGDGNKFTDKGFV